MTLPVAILAGGLGKRLGQKTINKAKVLIDVAGKPFISRQLNYLRDQGIKDIVICIAYLGEQIKDYIGNGSKYNLKIFYSDDGDQLLGTGGSVKKACRILGENFFILYGDSFLPIDSRRFSWSFVFNFKSFSISTISPICLLRLLRRLICSVRPSFNSSFCSSAIFT